MKHHTSLESKAHNKSSSRTFSRRHRSYRILKRARLKHKAMVIKGDQITQRSVVKPVEPYQLKRLSQEGITYYAGQGFGLGISLD